MNEYDKIINTNYNYEPISSESKFDKGAYLDRDFIISAKKLYEKISEPTNDITIIEVLNTSPTSKSGRKFNEFIEIHIPGAHYMYIDELGDVRGYKKSDDELFELFENLGINEESEVIFYSSYSRYGLFNASRFVVIAYYLGIKRVRLLDGGFQAWLRNDLPLESGENAPPLRKKFGLNKAANPHIIISTPNELISFMDKNPRSIIASVRSRNEFDGLNRGSSWNETSGEIYGAVFAGDNKLTNASGELSDPGEYMDDWNEQGITKNNNIIFSCGTGWRASTAFLILKQLGWENVFLFDGSWYQWYLASQKDPTKYRIQR